MRRRLLPLFLVSLMLTSSMASVLGASGREVTDNWEDGDAFVEISLISWVANQTEEWDSSGGLPDPQFRICFDVDGEDLDCVNTPTWENQWELNATWNYTIDIPDTSNLLNITIECEDNDAFNDDECDMNADVNEWKLYAEYNWSQNPNMTISGNGDGDGNGTWKNAASVWEVNVFGFGDEDGDGVPDNIDTCPNTTESFGNVNQSVFPGCSWGQLDFDADGIDNDNDGNILNFFQGRPSTNAVDIRSWSEVQDTQIIHEYLLDESGLESLSIINFRGADYVILRNQMFNLGNNSILPLDNMFCTMLVSGECQIQATAPTGTTEVFDYDGDGDLDIAGHQRIELNNGSFLWSLTDPVGRVPDLINNGNCRSYHKTIWLDFNKDGFLDGACVAAPGNSGQFLQSTCARLWDIKFQSATSEVIVLCSEGNDPVTMILHVYDTSLEHVQSFSLEGENNTRSPDSLMDVNSNGYLDIFIDQRVCLDVTNSLSITSGCIEVNMGNESGIDVLSRETIFAHDFDNDGDDDFGLSNGIIEVTETGLIFHRMLNSVYRDTHSTYFDYDGDGDYDYVFIEIDVHGYAQLYTKINPAIADRDLDGVKDSVDNCPNTTTGEAVDAAGCSQSQVDSDMDGINDATDLCPSSSIGSSVNSEGCAPNQLDSDGDGISDAMDLCPTTPSGESTNLEGCSQSEVDTDDDGVVNSNDACPGTAQGSVVDANGCSESDVMDNDADGDGVVDTYDACPSTTVGSTVDQNGCSDAQLDIDGDGVANTRDQCSGTSSGAEVSYYGCSAGQGDEDLDGVLNVDDDCPGSWFVDTDNPPETSNGCDGMLESQDDDEDGDGLVDTYDECPDTPAGQSVDDQGCTAAQRNTLADEASSEGDTGDAIVGMFCCFGLLWLVFSATTKSRKKPSSPPRYVQAPPQVIHQQSVQQQQQVMRELENQRRQAEHQVAQLQQQLHQSNQMSATQLASVQSQLSDMQQQVTATNMAKADMQRELGQMKIQEVERNTFSESPVNIQDSAVAGDSLIGSTKIENQTVNDADAIARAAAAAAIDAYRMGLDDRER